MGLVALGAVNVWLLTQIFGDFVPGGQAAFETVSWTPKLSTSQDGAMGIKAPRAHDQTLSHPVFFKTRDPFVARPVAPFAATNSAAPSPVYVDPGLVLGGIVITGSTRKAYIFQKTNPSGNWVQEGDEIVGWKISSVSPGVATLRKDGRDIELLLYPER
jgi:hypothetical protein